MNGIYFDIICLIYVILSGFIGLWFGGVNQMMSIVSSIISLEIAKYSYKYIVGILFENLSFSMFDSSIISFLTIFTFSYIILKIIFYIIMMTKKGPEYDEDNIDDVDDEDDAQKVNLKPFFSKTFGFIFGLVNGTIIFIIFLYILINFNYETKPVKIAHKVSKVLTFLNNKPKVVKFLFGKNNFLFNAKIILENYPYSYMFIENDPLYQNIQNNPIFDDLYEVLDDAVGRRDIKIVLEKEEISYVIAKSYVRKLFSSDVVKKYLENMDPEALNNNIFNIIQDEKMNKIKEKEKNSKEEEESSNDVDYSDVF